MNFIHHIHRLALQKVSFLFALQSIYPVLKRLHEAYMEHPAFLAALPEKQPDAPSSWAHIQNLYLSGLCVMYLKSRNRVDSYPILYVNSNKLICKQLLSVYVWETTRKNRAICGEGINVKEKVYYNHECLLQSFMIKVLRTNLQLDWE